MSESYSRSGTVGTEIDVPSPAFHFFEDRNRSQHSLF